MCGYTAQMLTNLESKLEEYLVAVDSMPTEYAESMEKSREKERRKVGFFSFCLRFGCLSYGG